MDASSARIAARSRNQAMEWSLVLVSQGIESTVDFAEDRNAWELEVAAADYARALETLRLYRWENRRWRWRQPLPAGDLVFDWTAVLWVVLVASFFWAQEHYPQVRDAGVLDTKAVSGGEWWRLFTSIWLHGDAGHLAANATIGVFLLGLAMGAYGTGIGLLAAYVAGLAGNLLSWKFPGPPHVSLGASGMVMGGLGLLAAQSFRWPANPRRVRWLLACLAGGLMLFVLLGVSPGTDVAAHLGGFAGGLALGAALLPLSNVDRNSLGNVSAGILFALLVVWPWLQVMHP